MSLKLYGYWRSSASYRVRIALNLKQLDYEYIPVHLVQEGGQQKTQEYKRLNPAMLVPTLVDEDADITLNQSLAIIEYLDDKYPLGAQLLPVHATDKARIRMICQDIACDIQPVANLRVLNKLKNEYGASQDGANKWAKDIIEQGLAALEKRLFNRAGKYAYGFSLTIADLCLVPQVYNALRFGVDMTKYPVVLKVYNNCMEIDAFVDASPEQQIDAVK